MMRQLSSVRECSPHAQANSRDLAILSSIAIVASFVAAVALAESAGSDSVIDFEARPPLFRPAHGLALVAVMTAGVLAMLRGRFRLLTVSGRAAFVALVLVAAGWAAASYRIEQILSPEILGATGPFVWFSLVFMLPGTDRSVWKWIDPVICALAYLTSALAVWAIVNSGGSAYVVGFTKHTAYGILLMWLGGWTLLSATSLRRWRLAVRCIPVMVLVLTAVYSQSRSWTILAFLLAAVFVILRAREQGWTPSAVRNVFLMATLAVVVGGAAAYTVLNGAVEGISQRLTEDTRTAQYVDFFSVVPVSDLLLGRGPKGTWYWYGIGEYRYFDNGFLWTLFIGGVPTLLSYCALVVWPAVRALWMSPRGQDAAVVCLALFWTVALTGFSTYTLPSVGFSSYLASLWAGRCHLILAESEAVRRRRAFRYVTNSWVQSREPAVTTAGGES